MISSKKQKNLEDEIVKLYDRFDEGDEWNQPVLYEISRVAFLHALFVVINAFRIFFRF